MSEGGGGEGGHGGGDFGGHGGGHHGGHHGGGQGSGQAGGRDGHRNGSAPGRPQHRDTGSDISYGGDPRLHRPARPRREPKVYDTGRWSGTEVFWVVLVVAVMVGYFVLVMSRIGHR